MITDYIITIRNITQPDCIPFNDCIPFKGYVSVKSISKQQLYQTERGNEQVKLHGEKTNVMWKKKQSSF